MVDPYGPCCLKCCITYIPRVWGCEISFSLVMSRCSFDVSLWWNRCIPMSFTSLVGIFTQVQGDVGLAIGI